MYRAFHNTMLTKRMKQFNKLISKTRYRIEQSFGTIKRRFSYRKASYFTTEKVNAQFTLKAMCLNLLKACNKIQKIPLKINKIFFQAKRYSLSFSRHKNIYLKSLLLQPLLLLSVVIFQLL